MVLLGMVPVFAQTPPITSRFSTRATRLPHFAPWMAARCPAGPEPMTMRSKLCMEPVRVGWGLAGWAEGSTALPSAVELTSVPPGGAGDNPESLDAQVIAGTW